MTFTFSSQQGQRVREVAMTSYITNSGLGNGLANKQAEPENVQCVYIHTYVLQSVHQIL